MAVAAWAKRCGYALPAHWYRARAWLTWGEPLVAPALGCVVVFVRGAGGHVGIVAGVDRLGRLMVIGGNQGNAVTLAPFDPHRALGYRSPPGVPLLTQPLPVLQASGPVSRNEA